MCEIIVRIWKCNCFEKIVIGHCDGIINHEKCEGENLIIPGTVTKCKEHSEGKFNIFDVIKFRKNKT